MTTEIVPINESKPFTDAEIKVFEEKYLEVMKNLSELTKTKKKLEEDDKKIREQLERAMDEYGIKSLDNKFVKVTRIPASAGTTKTVPDWDAFEKAEPDEYQGILEDYPKTVTTGRKKAYVKIEAKG